MEARCLKHMLLAQNVQLPNYSDTPSLKNFGDLFVPGNNYDLALGILVSRLLTFAIAGVGIFFFVRIISAGYGYLTNAGDQNKIQSASKELTNALIGLLLVISAFFIFQAILTIFGISTI